MKKRLLLVPFALLGVAAFTAQAQESPRNVETEAKGPSVQRIISITDSGWTTNTLTSDCATGWGDDTWQLTVTQSFGIAELTVTANDCCCPGDYYEVWVDDRLIGTTPNLAPPWGCDFSGPLSSGSFRVTLCPGTHVIKVRDAGFDGHSLAEIQAQNMCPAGFTVAGSLTPAPPTLAQTSETSMAVSEAPPPPSPEVQQLQQQLAAVAPFVVTDERGMQRLLTDDARRAGISGEALGLGHRTVALNNRIIMAALRDEEPPVQRVDFAFIEPLFLYQAQQGHPCGDRQHPTPCPPRVASTQFFSTQAEVEQHLQSLGYHRTARYASGGAFGIDFTIVVPGPAGCGTGTFRTQAIIHRQGDCWTYNTQGPEPNPEVLSYIGSWPYFSWPGYVRWWHLGGWC